METGVWFGIAIFAAVAVIAVIVIAVLKISGGRAGKSAPGAPAVSNKTPEPFSGINDKKKNGEN